MADSTTSALSSAGALDGTETLYIVKSGSKKSLLSAVATYIRGLFTATPVTIAEGGTNAATAAAARGNLGLTINTNVQAYSANLATLAGIAFSANVQTILNAADFAAIRTALGLVISTNVQAYSANLTSYATVAPSANVLTLLGAANFSAFRASAGLAIGTDVQAYDADLAALAGVTSAADKVPYFTGSGTAAVTDFTSFARTLTAATTAPAARAVLGVGAGSGDVVASNNLSDLASAATARTNLGLGIGVNVQAYSANLTTYAGIAPSANIQTFLGSVDAAAARTALGLGTAAVTNTGTSGASVARTDGANTWSGVQTFSAGANVTPAASPASNAVGRLLILPNTQNNNYTTLVSDIGNHIYHTSATAHIWTLGNGCPGGAAISFLVENGSGNITLSGGAATLRWGALTGSRTLSANCTATAIMTALGEWRLTGDGIS